MEHPYQQYAGTELWSIVDQAVTVLETNQDLRVSTARPYVVGFLCHSLARVGAVSGEASGQLNLPVSKDSALVLFELFARFEETERLTLEHPAEEHALWHLQAALERQLVEPFDPGYDALVAAARALGSRVVTSATTGA